jgi:hypothetical protein
MKIATRPAHITELDTRKRSAVSRQFEDALRQKILRKLEVTQMSSPQFGEAFKTLEALFDRPRGGCSGGS